MKISAVICTHNPREDFLRRVLAGLQSQTLPLADWELLLVDNGSKTPVAEKFDLRWHPNARHIREEELGLTPTRLRGIKEAKADIVIFVDDDTVLDSDYLESAFWVGMQWPFVGVWGGSCRPEYEVPLPDWVGEQVWRLTVVEVKEDVWSNQRDGFETKPVGAGFCLRRNVGLRFVERCARRDRSKVMDRTGTALSGYGDMDLCQCAIDAGFGTGRSTKLKLTHLIPKNRLTLDYFVRHAEGDAASHLVYRAGCGLPWRQLLDHSWFKALVWRLHCLRRGVPMEQREIHAAYLRGLQKGKPLAEAIEAQKKS